ncbi:MAG: hypothetical protein Unbinned5081contig1003_12 [Prokaryotic dsDNA virus sp.]|nr:MAG: hypothetical protein Unbinned5081contig1003_12 [Prokaryotic dsDNA virus sp.]|tara:strand:- start:9911 stop:10147 length:237 start_codon:yes stop_codon:yes gene_type:complete
MKFIQGQDLELIIMLIVGVAWLIRLESKVLFLEKQHDEHKETTKEKDAAMWAKIDSLSNNINLIMQSLVRIEESIKNK